MKYLSLDIETTGLDPKTCQILQIAAVVEDTFDPKPLDELPTFVRFIRHDAYTGNAYALQLNSWILKILSGEIPLSPYSIGNMQDTMRQFLKFLMDHFGEEKITVAGKNVAGFDIPFLARQVAIVDRFRHRTLDPGPLYTDFTKDTIPPDLNTCKKRAGINTPVAHDALEDALDVIRVLRAKY